MLKRRTKCETRIYFGGNLETAETTRMHKHFLAKMQNEPVEHSGRTQIVGSRQSAQTTYEKIIRAVM